MWDGYKKNAFVEYTFSLKIFSIENKLLMTFVLKRFTIKNTKTAKNIYGLRDCSVNLGNSRNEEQ